LKKDGHMTIALSILGVSGKMGKRVLALALEDSQFKVVGGTARSYEGDLACRLFSNAASAIAECDVAIDFSSKDILDFHLESAWTAKKALVIGTTGHEEKAISQIQEAAKEIPILFSPNFSFGIALCLEAVERMAQALKGTSRVKIIETHHVHKKDSPSGTALALAQAAKCDPNHIRSIREGEVVGNHKIIFECAEERIEFTHSAHSRDVFAAGALRAAKFLVGRPPGLYSLKDLINY
jgi:4-hydroxy-tetrahydrodipicolinate reductase